MVNYQKYVGIFLGICFFGCFGDILGRSLVMTNIAIEYCHYVVSFRMNRVMIFHSHVNI